MGLSLHSAFTTYEHTVLSGTITVASGTKLTELTGSYLGAFGATIEDITYSNSIDKLAVLLTDDFGGTWEGSYNNISNQYTISGSIPFKSVWSSFAKEVWGFQDQTGSFINIVTSSVQPGFIWRASLNGRVSETKVFDQSNVATERLTVDGRVFSLVKSGSAKLEAWEFRYEPKKKVFNKFSGSIAPWTYQRHVEHVGARKPWVYFSSDDGTVGYGDRTAVYKYTEGGSSFNPQSSFFGSSDFAYNMTVEAVQVNALTDAEVAAAEIPINEPSDIGGLVGMYWPVSASLSGLDVLALSSSVSGNHLDKAGGAAYPQYDATNSYFNNNPTIAIPGGTDGYFTVVGSGSMNFDVGSGGSLVLFYTVDRHTPDGTLLQVEESSTFNLARLTMHDSYRRTRMKLQKTNATTFDTVSMTSDQSNLATPTFAVGTWSETLDDEGLGLFWSDGIELATHRSSQQVITGSQSFDDIISTPTVVFSVGGGGNNCEFTFGFAAIYDRKITAAESEALRDWLLEDFGYT